MAASTFIAMPPQGTVAQRDWFDKILYMTSALAADEKPNTMLLGEYTQILEDLSKQPNLHQFWYAKIHAILAEVYEDPELKLKHADDAMATMAVMHANMPSGTRASDLVDRFAANTHRIRTDIARTIEERDTNVPGSADNSNDGQVPTASARAGNVGPAAAAAAPEDASASVTASAGGDAATPAAASEKSVVGGAMKEDSVVGAAEEGTDEA